MSYDTCLALTRRTDRVGSNTVSDQLEVLSAAIDQIPASFWRDLLITCDGAGATEDLVAGTPSRSFQ